MTEEQKKKAEQDVIYLAGCAIKEQVPEQKRVETMNLDDVYKVASRHMIAAAISYALESAGYKSERTASSINKAIRRAVLYKAAWEEIRKELEEAQIWYMPLKGSVLQYYYPKFGMREMTDYDILIDAERAADIRSIMEGLGYTTASYNTSKHDVYTKEPIFNIQMHTKLFEPQNDGYLYNYYMSVENHLEQGKGFEKHFSHEDFYLYLIAHEYQHYILGGTGLRSLMDAFVFLCKEPDLDMEYVSSEAKKIGIEDFEEKNRSLAMHLFNEEELALNDNEMLKYILSSGVHGTTTNRIRNKMHRNHMTKFGYILDRLFVPVSRNDVNYNAYAQTYPLFYKYKVLLPLLPLYRALRAMRTGRLIDEVRALKKVK